MKRLRNESLDDVVNVELTTDSLGNERYELRDQRMPGAVTTMSKTGAEMFGASARIFEEIRPILDAWMEHFADFECPHGVRLDDDIWGWHTNDYAFDLLTEPERAVMILYGYHEPEINGEWFCLPAWFDRAVGAFGWSMDPSWYEASRALQLSYMPPWLAEAMR